ncbi:hypothetical protein A9259_08005 [Vibrio cyclitrophicus]|uniref:BRCT domain-containing protein n=1 Tax=Vibrio cyclitrophicus TaxID=47951 RepID=UPI0007EEF289|nr:BRCT domain-containing protein [Vibrio cyclitrophicus]OBS98392.1 hypothetical protein A9259_08005 [Vibrio cyclitrophicus]
MSKDTALTKLKGILAGIITDENINAGELVYLDSWLRERQDIIGSEGDVVDLLEQISDVLEDGVITEEEMEDTLQLIDDILEYQENPPITSDLDETFGYVSGILADDKLSEIEISNLRVLLEQVKTIPLCALLLDQMNQNPGKIKDTLKSFAGHYFHQVGTTEDLATFLSDDLPADFEIKGKSVCFTGNIIGMPRSVMKRVVASKGAVVKNAVSSKVDVLVVGDGCSNGWVSNTLGNKLEAATTLKLNGHSILIIPGDTWISYCNEEPDSDYSTRKQQLWNLFGEPKTFEDVLDATERVCEGLPLSIESDFEESAEARILTVHRQWKNGNSLKKYEVGFNFIKYHLDDEGARSLRTRCWGVKGASVTTTFYENQSRGVEQFRELLTNLAANYSGL